MSGLRGLTTCSSPDFPAEAQNSSVLRVLSSRALTPIHPPTRHGVPHAPRPHGAGAPNLGTTSAPQSVSETSEGQMPPPAAPTPSSRREAATCPKLGPKGRDPGRPRPACSPFPGSRDSALTPHPPVPPPLPTLLRCLRAPCSSAAARRHQKPKHSA